MQRHLAASLGGLLAAATLAASAWGAQAGAAPPSEPTIAAGRYLVKLAGCNDCHTPGYGATGGKVPEPDWLVGDKLGWQGPWGTTYPANLRLLVSQMSEDQWLAMARHKEMRPPMPWFTLRDMKQEDLRAVYRFIRFLGPKGEPAPAYLPPGAQPQGPVVAFPAPPAK
ncbi:MAG: cytochrome C [Ramlibacter sp.]